MMHNPMHEKTGTCMRVGVMWSKERNHNNEMEILENGYEEVGMQRWEMGMDSVDIEYGGASKAVQPTDSEQGTGAVICMVNEGFSERGFE